MVEPEKIIIFRVPWIDDFSDVQINRGYCVEFNLGHNLKYLKI
jgi:glutamate dehydrogenase (NADP+)